MLKLMPKVPTNLMIIVSQLNAISNLGDSRSSQRYFVDCFKINNQIPCLSTNIIDLLTEYPRDRQMLKKETCGSVRSSVT